MAAALSLAARAPCGAFIERAFDSLPTQLPDMPGWRPDPKGGFIRIPPPAEPEPEPEALPYGWMEDKDGTGLVRIPDEQLPPPFRPGYWCKIANLSQDTDKNGLIVEVLDTKPDPDIGAVEIR
mgnify:CR=1 FL=1